MRADEALVSQCIYAERSSRNLLKWLPDSFLRLDKSRWAHLSGEDPRPLPVKCFHHFSNYKEARYPAGFYDLIYLRLSKRWLCHKWIVRSYSERNWVEVFYREAKGWLGITEYQVRDERSIHRHWILVFTAHSLIQWQQLTGGLRRWSTKPLETFPEALRAYKSAVEFLLVRWISIFPEVFAAHRFNRSLVWC